MLWLFVVVARSAVVLRLCCCCPVLLRVVAAAAVSCCKTLELPTYVLILLDIAPIVCILVVRGGFFGRLGGSTENSNLGETGVSVQQTFVGAVRLELILFSLYTVNWCKKHRYTWYRFYGVFVYGVFQSYGYILTFSHRGPQ